MLRWIGTLLAVALLIYLLADQGWDEISAAVHQIDGWRFILALILVMISRLAVAGRWYVLIHSAGMKVSPRQTTSITFAGLFAANFLPTTIGGDVVRLAWAIRVGYDRAVCVASLVADRLVGMAGMAMALPFGLPGYLRYFQATGSTSIGLYSLALPWVSLLTEKLAGFTHRLFLALKLWLEKPMALLGALAFTWVHMLCTYAMVWLLLTGMGENITFWLVMGLWSAAYFVTLLPISINGMGVQELAMTFFYTTIGGISPSSGLTLALLMRVIQMIASLPGALFLPQILAGRSQPVAK
jgi:uncharacterized membrane protein YbhN (UPF0104 family)